MSELYLYPILFEHKNCPNFVSAMGIALSASMWIAIGLFIIVLSFCVLLGRVKPVGFREVEKLGSTFFPSPTANAREIITLRPEMAAMRSEMTALREEQAGAL